MSGVQAAVRSREIRKFIFDYFKQRASASVIEQIMKRFKLDGSDAFGLLADLENAHHIILVRGTQRILMARPFSNVATPFRVKIAKDGRKYFANRAWNAVAFHVMLGRNNK